MRSFVWEVTTPFHTLTTSQEQQTELAKLLESNGICNGNYSVDAWELNPLIKVFFAQGEWFFGNYPKSEKRYKEILIDDLKNEFL